MFKTVNVRNDTRKILEGFFKKHLAKDMIIGCGDKPFKLSVHKHAGVGFSDSFYNTSHLDIISNAYNVLVDNEVTDAVISAQVRTPRRSHKRK